MKIMLVENDEEVSDALACALRDEGHTVFQAQTGDAAVDFVDGHMVDLVLCDIMIPLMNGLSYMKMRRKFMAMNIPVVIMTAIENDDEDFKGPNIDFETFLKNIPTNSTTTPLPARRLEKAEEVCEGIAPEEVIV
jgi:DNA-binding response OmpR family regulator